jgi:CspA family cold shock protein
MTKTVGRVRWFNRVAGFGFISVEGTRDVFVREAAISVPGRRALREGEAVELEIVEREGQREAVNVVPLA